MHNIYQACGKRMPDKKVGYLIKQLPRGDEAANYFFPARRSCQVCYFEINTGVIVKCTVHQSLI